MTQPMAANAGQTADTAPIAVGTQLTWQDKLKHWGYRWGIGRMSARVKPGLYAVNEPDAQSPVLISANYRMSFDILRSQLADRKAWILVLDTKGINVWCAAGKGTFGTGELILRILTHELAKHVEHRRVIVPQLGAPGVAAHVVREKTGFLVKYGPVRAADLPVFLETGKASPEMRRVTFKLAERLAVVPIEILPAFVPLLLVAGGIALATQWPIGLGFFVAGLSSTIAVPAFHDWLPGTWLSIKGAVWGLVISSAICLLLAMTGLPAVLLILSSMAASSFAALNFTGATTYTSVNGVKREMRWMMPWILSAAGLAVLGWIFIGVRRFWL